MAASVTQINRIPDSESWSAGMHILGTDNLENPPVKIIVVSTFHDPHDECIHSNPCQSVSETLILVAVSRVPRINRDHTIQP